jgi:hypothetical protein
MKTDFSNANQDRDLRGVKLAFAWAVALTFTILSILIFAGCASDPTRNPLYGRQAEFDARIADSDRDPAWAYQNCLAYQRSYFTLLNWARQGEITLSELRGFERRYDEEIRIIEKP